MKQKRRAHLAVEQLEQRWVPANVKFVSGYLLISPSAGEAALNLTVVQSATTANTFTVTDQGKTLGSYAGVGNIFITGGNGADTVSVDLKGKTYTGGLTANTGSGADTVTVMSSAAGGALLGNVNLNGSGGNHVVNLATGANGITIGGSVQATDTLGANTFNFGATTASTLGKNLTLTGYNTVSLGGAAGDTINGGITVNDGALGLGAKVTLNDKLTVNSALNVTTGAGNDTITIGSITVNGNAQVNTGSGNDTVALAAGTSTPTVGGNLTITGGSGNDSVNLAGGASESVGGTLTIGLGDGTDTVTLDNANLTVAGSLRLSLGNGNDSVTVDSTVNGNMYWSLGSGTDTVTIGSAPGGRLYWTSGNGDDSVTFGDATSVGGQSWNVQMQFGTGSDTLTLADSTTTAPGITPATPDFLTGFVDMGGPPGGNSFDPTGSTGTGSWVIVPPFTLQNT
jgi:hypothetical protein